MDFSDSHHFDAPLDRVWAMFRDPASHVAKFEAMGHRDIEVLEERSDDEGFHLVVRRVVEMDLPSFARRVIQPASTVTTTDDWHRQADGSYRGEQSVDTQGAPVRISARTHLAADGDGAGTTYAIDVSVDVKVPLIGGKIANWAKGTVAEQLDEEFAAGDRWLAR
jgi:hypothetical protein